MEILLNFAIAFREMKKGQWQGTYLRVTLVPTRMKSIVLKVVLEKAGDSYWGYWGSKLSVVRKVETVFLLLRTFDFVRPKILWYGKLNTAYAPR